MTQPFRIVDERDNEVLEMWDTHQEVLNELKAYLSGWTRFNGNVFLRVEHNAGKGDGWTIIMRINTNGC